VFVLTFNCHILCYNFSKYDEDSPPQPILKNKREEPYINKSQLNGFHTAKTELAS